MDVVSGVWKPTHIATIIVLALWGLLLGGCDGKRAKPAASPQAYERLPERTDEQAAYELLDTLLDSPVTVALPPGFTALLPQHGNTVVPLPNAALPASPPLSYRGGVLITFKQPNPEATITQSNPGLTIGFQVYDTAAEAGAAFRATDAIRRPPDYNAYTPDGFDLPARCRPEPASSTFLVGPGGFTTCLLQAGNVIVAAFSPGAAGSVGGDDEHAVAMARAALAHLQDVKGKLVRAAAAPPARRPVRVGILSEARWNGVLLLQVFRDRLTALGWVGGRDLALEYRFANTQHERLPELAAELVRERVDVIVPLSLPAALAARDVSAGAGIPVVFALWEGSDPLAGGLVPNLARPGANITGVAFPTTAGLPAKRLDLLAEALPSVTRIGVLIETTGGPLWRELEETARARDIELVSQEIRSHDEIPAAVAAAKAAGAQALLQADDNTNFSAVATPLFQSAAQHRLPIVFNGYHTGGLFSYVVSFYAVITRAAEYVDLVLQGTPPAQLPIELVRDYDLFVNLNHAQRVGVMIAPSVLARATEFTDPGTVRPRRVR